MPAIVRCCCCGPISTTFDPTYSATWYVSLSLNAPKIHFFFLPLRILAFFARFSLFTSSPNSFSPLRHNIDRKTALVRSSRKISVYSVLLLKTNAKRTERQRKKKNIRLWNWERIHSSPTDVPSTASRLWHYFIYFVFFFLL